jgi:tRNA (guanosine-2'-O-)-methyltransferase
MEEISPRQEKIRQLKENRKKAIVILEDIHDPHNAAAVWRSCDAFGIGTVYLIFDKEEEFDPKEIGKVSSSSANKWIDFKIFHSTKDCLDQVKKEGFKTYATILDKEAKSIYETKFVEKAAIMLGNEHAGLSETAIKMADYKIYIPMVGMVQSLNLSVTAGICVFEYGRQIQSL